MSHYGIKVKAAAKARQILRMDYRVLCQQSAICGKKRHQAPRSTKKKYIIRVIN